MKITLPYVYTDSVVPYRCRIPRKVLAKDEITLTIHEVSSKDAPVAIIERSATYDDDGNIVHNLKYYYWWRNNLYTPYRFQRVSLGSEYTQNNLEFKDDPYPHSYDIREPYSYGYPNCRTKAERRRDMMEWARSILFIDGVRMVKTQEPRYVVQTFGLGHNHGGTGLFADNSYNSNISKKNYFRIDQFEKAVEAATRTALGRGDDKSLPFDDDYTTKFQILIPEAIRLNPQKEHGNGDKFMNKVESVISSSPSKDIAALGMFSLFYKGA